MISRPLAIALLAAGCLSAAVAGSYVAGRQSGASRVSVADGHAGTPATTPQPVSETEAVIEPAAEPAGIAVPPPLTEPEERRAAPRPRPQSQMIRRTEPPITRNVPQSRDVNRTGVVERRDEQARPADAGGASVPAREPEVEVARDETPAAASTLTFEEIVIPASSVIGLEIESSLSTETARVEDRVDARVTRDVYADGRVAIPARSRVIGAVTLIERGGKIKERARLGVRFHTLVLGDGRQVNLRTETITREGESVSAESGKKIGGAAVGGAVLGAIMGGGKGALLGGAAGAAGGTAVVMAGGRNAATLPSGTVVTARVTTPVSIEVEKR